MNDLDAPILADNRSEGRFAVSRSTPRDTRRNSR